MQIQILKTIFFKKSYLKENLSQKLKYFMQFILKIRGFNDIKDNFF